MDAEGAVMVFDVFFFVFFFFIKTGASLVTLPFLLKENFAKEEVETPVPMFVFNFFGGMFLWDRDGDVGGWVCFTVMYYCQQ